MQRNVHLFTKVSNVKMFSKCLNTLYSFPFIMFTSQTVKNMQSNYTETSLLLDIVMDSGTAELQQASTQATSKQSQHYLPSPGLLKVIYITAVGFQL